MSRWWGESTSSLFRRKIWNRKLLFCLSSCSPAASIQTRVKCPWLCTNHAQEQCSSLFKSCIRLWGSLQNQGEVKSHFIRMLVGSFPAPPTRQAPDYGLNLRYSMILKVGLGNTRVSMVVQTESTTWQHCSFLHRGNRSLTQKQQSNNYCIKH